MSACVAPNAPCSAGSGLAQHEATRGLGDEHAQDGREALVKARLAFAAGQLTAAVDLALRGFILEADGAGELVATLLAQSGDVVVVNRVRQVVGAATNLNDPMWAAAFAFAEGRREDARRAWLGA